MNEFLERIAPEHRERIIAEGQKTLAGANTRSLSSA